MKLMRIFFLLFLLLPLCEIYFLLKIGVLIGAPLTILMVIGTAVSGAWLLRIQGFSTWMRLQKNLAEGRIPTLEMMEGPILLVGGALLLTPGFISDTLGFLCLLPVMRRKLARYLIENWLQSGLPPDSTKQAPHTIEGEYRREDRD